MGIHSGKWGQVNGVNTMRQWSIVDTMTPAKAVASNTLLGTARRDGVRSWSGSYTAFGGQPVSMPGAIAAIVAYGAPDNDTLGGTGLRYTGNALISRVAITWNWATGAILQHVVTFLGDLELSKATGADPGDATVPVLPVAALTDIEYSLNNANSFASIPNMTTATLTLSVATESYVNSNTVFDGQLWTGQKAGPLDWSLAIGQQDTERLSGIFDIGDVVELKLYTDATAFWKLTYGYVRDFSGITVNREGAIIARTINIDMNAYYSSTAGSILLPDTTTYWP